MFFRVSLLVAVLGVTITTYTLLQHPRYALPVRGRPSTVLFLTDVWKGLSNVHVATTFGLLEHYPDIQVHYASFGPLEKEMARVSKAAQVKNSAAKPVIWHLLTSAPSYAEKMAQFFPNTTALTRSPSVKDRLQFARDTEIIMAPWDAEEYLALYSEIQALIEEVNPAVVVIDVFFWPATDATRNLNRLYAVVNPNALTEPLVAWQPWLAGLWKYPA